MERKQEGSSVLQDQDSLRNTPMKKLLLIAVPLLLSGCSVYNQFVERMQTDTLEYRCDEKPLTVKINNPVRKPALCTTTNC
jgi:membrane-bound inhibitor of C-type lysozyme